MAKQKQVLIIGGSRGLGLAVAQFYQAQGDMVWVAARSAKDSINLTEPFQHIACDLRDPIKAAEAVGNAVKGQGVDLFVYCAGIWESASFTDTPPTFHADVITTNLTSFITISQAIESELVAVKGKVFAIGSTCGLENEGADCVSYVASKFGLRGAVASLRTYLRPHGITVCCINPGSIATDFAFGSAVDALGHHSGKRMPVEDIIAIIATFATLSPSACPKELDIPAMYDVDV